MGCQGAVNDTQHFAHQLRIAGEQETQLKRETQHPLANGLPREDIIYQEGRTFYHTPGTTAGAKSATFTAESDQMFVLAVPTLDA